MTTATCDVATAHASRYLQQLCKHFAHKLPATFDPTTGRIDFSIGGVDLAADGERLTISVTPSAAEKLADLQDVVARHLVRFAFRETLEFDWRTA
jgi:hypothetical protein